MMFDTHIHFCGISRYKELVSFCDRMEYDHVGLISLPDSDQGTFNDAIKYALRKDPDRYSGFGCLDYRGMGAFGFDPAKQVYQLHKDGFFGLKLLIGKPLIEKRFGLSLNSKPISDAVDAAESLGMPILAHVADPPDFWAPYGIYAADFPPYISYIESFEELLVHHSSAQFICPHLMFLGKGLDHLESVLSSYDNLMFDTAPGRWFYRVLAEQREDAREFFSLCRNRILFGTDAMFFESDYEMFPYTSVDVNCRNAIRLKRFLAADEIIDDPYPWKEVVNGHLDRDIRSLALEQGVFVHICDANPERVLQYQQRL